VFLAVQNIKSDAQQVKTPLSGDRLNSLLDYFYANTNDTIFQQALQRSKVLFTTDGVTDSLAKQLVFTEKLLFQSVEDSGLLNLHPLNKDSIFSLCDLAANLLQPLPPENNNRYYATALNNLGFYYKGIWGNLPSDYMLAFNLFTKAKEIREKTKETNSPEYAEILSNLGDTYEWKGDMDKGRSLKFQALAIEKTTTGGLSRDYAGNLYSVAHLYTGMKRYDTAISLLEEEIDVWKKISGAESPVYALHLSNIALIFDELSQYSRALQLYTEAKDVTQKTLGKENRQYAWCVNGMGEMYYRLSAYQTALPYFKEALNIYQHLPGEKHTAPLYLSNIATTYMKMGEYAHALPLLQRAIALVEQLSGQESDAVIYYANHLANLYMAMGQNNEALSVLRHAIDIYKSQHLEENSFYARALNTMAVLYGQNARFDSALYLGRQAADISGRILGETHRDYLNSLNGLADLCTDAHQYDSAKKILQQLIAVRKKLLGEEHADYATSLYSLGNLYMATKDYDSAGLLYRQALAIRQKALGTEHAEYIKTLNSLALLDIASGNTTEAGDLLLKANSAELKNISNNYISLSEHEKMVFVNDQSSQFNYLPSLLLTGTVMKYDIVQQVYANELTLKGMVLNDQQSLLNSIRKSGDSSAIDLYNEWRINKITLGKQSLLTNDERSLNFDSLREVTNRLEQNLSLTSAAFRQQQQTITTKNIAVKLLQGEAAIEFIKFRVYRSQWTDSVMYAALIILAGDSIPAFIPLFEEKQLMNLLNKAGKNENAINRFYSETFGNDKESSGNALYRLIWGPLEKYLSGVHTIYYAPAGLLHRIAFGALPVDTAHFLLDRYALNQVLSTRSVALPATVTQKSSAINIWGDINYDLKKVNLDNQSHQIAQRGQDAGLNANTGKARHRDTVGLYAFKWPALSGTRAEMDGIKEIFMNAGIAVTTTTDSLATEEVFRSLDGKSPPLLHIATHGFFWPANSKFNSTFTLQQDAMFRSGLVLAGANAIWAAQKPASGKDDGILTSYEIAQLNLNNTDLVVLSACETALGDLQDNEGVIGLQRAFKIAGVKQMILSLWKVPDKETVELMTMFYRNLINGLSPAASLRAAQLKIKETYPPYDWAAFVLIE
jgi:CHAT domain-containing protein